MIASTIYHRHPAHREPSRIHDVLQIASSAAGTGHEPRFWEGLRAGSDTFLKGRAIDSSASRIDELLRERRLSSISFHEFSPQETSSRPQGTTLVVSLDPAGTDETPAVAPYIAYMLVREDHLRSQDALVAAWTAVWQLLDGVYGFIYVGVDHTDALMEAATAPIVPWDEELSEHMEQRVARLERAQAARLRIGEVVPGAYWGNFFNRSVVDRLGGPEALRSELGLARVDALDRGDVYCQVTKRLAEKAPGLMARFNEYLARRGVLLE